MNSENKWTPGPWIIDDKSPEFIKSSEGEVIAMAARPNAHLIAAAPMLYKFLLYFCQNFANDDPDPREIQDIYENAVGVLAQASGEVML